MPYPEAALDETLESGQTGALEFHQSLAREHNRLRLMVPPAGVRLTADHAAFTTTTQANVTGLAFALASGAYYRATFYVLYQSAGTAVGIRLGLTTPAFTRFAGQVTIHGFAADGAASSFTGPLTTSGDSVTSTTTVAATTDYLAIIEAVIVPSAAGSLQVQASAEVAGSVVVRQGSHGMLYTIV